ncbi:MAG: hypothetical protein JWO97_4389 [Acidobacteria bacterium]|nr:hypothetical protein [Acidobacteriota bacterium]
MQTTLTNILKVHIVTVALTLLFAGAIDAAETRSHFMIVHRDHTPAYYVTSITDQSQQRSSRRYLISDTTGPLLEVETRTDYAGNVSWTRYRSGKSGKWVKVSYDLPFTSRTRDGRIAEMKANPSLAAIDIPVIVETQGGVVRELESALKPGHPGRDRARKVTDADLRATISSLRAVFGLPMFADAAPAAKYIIDGPTSEQSRDLMIANVPPDCAFDAKWGAPCTNAQISTIHATIKAGKTPTTY